MKPSTITDEQWEGFDEKTFTMIQLSMSNEVLHENVHEESATSAWRKLKSLYIMKSFVSRLHLKQRLYMLCMNEDTPVKHYMDEFTSIIIDLENTDVKVDDKDQALLLLYSSLPSFKNFWETLIYWKNFISFEDIKKSLLSKKLMDRELT